MPMNKITCSDLNLHPRWARAMTIGDMFDQTAESCPGEAVVFPDKRITYPELAELTNRYARSLMALGVERNDKVGILLPAGIDFIAIMLAIFKAGAVAVPVNGRFKERELRHVVNKSEMKVLFSSSNKSEFVDYTSLILNTFPLFFDPASEVAKGETKLTHVVCISGDVPSGFLTHEDFERAAELINEADLLQRRAGVRIRDTAILMFTSGTTAMPKAAMLSHEALFRGGTAYSEGRWGLTPSDKVWTALPLFHIAAMIFSIACFTAGSTYCHGGFFNADISLRQLVEEKCTVALPAFETLWLEILNHSKFSASDLSSLRLVFVLGVPEQLQRMQERLPHAVQIAAFGSSEASGSVSMSLPTDPLETRLNTCGHAMPGLEVRITDPETIEELGPNQRGEIQYRGASLFHGYYNDPELTREAIDEDGWFHSGDLGKLDNDGRLSFLGRLKDMLKVGGENVAAVEVEDYLISHPAVLIAQVVSAPDSRYVEVPAAFIQLKTGFTVKEQEIIDFCLGKIATFKVPRYVRFVTEWPMSGTKIQKYVLRAQIADELQKAGITEAPKLQAITAQTGAR